MSDCPSRLQLDRLEHGELEGGAVEELRSHVDGCPQCQSWLEQARAKEAALMAEAADGFAARVAARASVPSRDRARSGLRAWLATHRPLLVGLAAAAVVGAIIITPQLVAPPPTPGDGGEHPSTLIKGSNTLKVHCRAADGQVSGLEPGDPVRAGDAIRFEVSSSNRSHVLVIAVQRGGQTSIYAPFDGAQSLPLTPGKAQLLPGSVILEQADELLIVVLSDAPIDADRARAAASKAYQAAGGQLAAIRDLALPGDQLRRLLQRQRAADR